MRKILVTIAVVLLGCASKPSASDVCAKIQAAGIGAKCHEGERKMLTSRAAHKVDFDLVHVAGKQGAVMSFEKAEDYDATVKAFEQAAMLAGPHRYGNAKALIFVQANDGLKADEGAKLKAIVDAL